MKTMTVQQEREIQIKHVADKIKHWEGKVLQAGDDASYEIERLNEYKTEQRELLN